MAHRNQSGAGARIVRRSAGTAWLLKEAAPTQLHRPATDRPTSYREKHPAHSIAQRQQRHLAVRGASSMLEHPAVLFRSGRIRGHISFSATAARRSPPRSSNMAAATWPRRGATELIEGGPEPKRIVILECA